MTVPAHFKSRFSSQTVRKGSSVAIVCMAFGEIPITIIVTKDRLQLDANREPRYAVLSDQRTDSTALTITIAQCDRRDSALYTCIAANQYGRDEHNHQLIVEGMSELT